MIASKSSAVSRERVRGEVAGMVLCPERRSEFFLPGVGQRLFRQLRQIAVRRILKKRTVDTADPESIHAVPETFA
jgi:hypothetical protein